MSHAAAEACTQRLAAGRGDGYRLAAAMVAAIARSPVECSYTTAEHWTTALAAKPLVQYNICTYNAHIVNIRAESEAWKSVTSNHIIFLWPNVVYLEV